MRKRALKGSRVIKGKVQGLIRLTTNGNVNKKRETIKKLTRSTDPYLSSCGTVRLTCSGRTSWACREGNLGGMARNHRQLEQCLELARVSMNVVEEEVC